MLSRLGVLLALALLCLLSVPAAAAPTPCVPPIVCPTEEPTTPPPTKTTSPTPVRTTTAAPTSTRSSTFSPRPQSTRTGVRPTASPAPAGTPVSTDGPFSSVAPVKVTPADSAGSERAAVDKLIGLIIGAALLLGIGGASGLYLTRERDEL